MEGKCLSSQISDFPELFYAFSFPIFFQELIIPLVVNADNPQLVSQHKIWYYRVGVVHGTLLKLTDHVFVMSKLCNTGKDWKQFSQGKVILSKHVLTVVKGNVLTSVFLNLTKYLCCLNRQWQKTEKKQKSLNEMCIV